MAVEDAMRDPSHPRNADGLGGLRELFMDDPAAIAVTALGALED